jgi:transcriptional regulator with XRE-family HTH domain
VPPKSGKLKEREKLQRALVAVLKASREDADVTRQELAKRVGLTYSQIVNIEHGRRAVQADDLILIAKALGIEPEQMLQRILRW